METQDIARSIMGYFGIRNSAIKVSFDPRLTIPGKIRIGVSDVYFLQQLHKTTRVDSLTGTIVHPSPRSSYRVPFGTGRFRGSLGQPAQAQPG